MTLLARVWNGLVYLLNIATLSPVGPKNYGQVPLANAKLSQLPSDAKTSLKGPIFIPPGTQPLPDGTQFKCDYSNMIGWESCSTENDRTCWLRNPDMGQFDIYTDYEALRPHGITRNYTLVASDAWLNADGQNFTNAKILNLVPDGWSNTDENRKLLNNTYPGPWIQACWGDVLNITVINDLKYNGTAIHWHGLRQYLTMHMDGVPGVTQCPIAPGDSFSYVINTTQYGSSWYHSHYSLQYADGLAGPIVCFDAVP